MNILNQNDNLIAYWPLNEGKANKCRELINDEESVVNYVFNNAEFKDDSSPIWKQGIIDSSLLFDGYSTWIESEHEKLMKDIASFSISVWIAPRTFKGEKDDQLASIISQHNQNKNKGFILGLYINGEVSFQLGTSQSWFELWSKEYIKKDQWSFLTAVYDDSQNNIALYINGKKANSKKSKKELEFSPAFKNVFIGKNDNSKLIAETFNLSMFSGLMNELKIYDRALDSDEVEKIFLNYKEKNNTKIAEIDKKTLQLDPKIYEGDRHRPSYHIIAPGHWMNEPHAPFYYNGKYHLFYQHNPKGPYWNHIHWGHWISDDLVNWENMPIALFPGKNDFDPDGIWSGNAVVGPNGLPVLFYTAGNFNNSPDQGVAIARSNYLKDQDVEFKKWNKNNKLIIEKPENIGLTENDFRDPFPWKEDDEWFCLVGSGIEDKGGTALIFKSKDFKNWELKGHLMDIEHNKFPYLGPIWELPVLLPIKDKNNKVKKHIFLISPVGEGADVEVFYWIGEWDKDSCSFIPEQEEPSLIDYGDFHFTGPSGMVDPLTGRSIIFTISQGERTPEAEYNAGWAHNGGLPLSLFLKADNTLGLEPIAELKKLRKEKLITVKENSLSEVNKKLGNIKGDMLEVKLNLKSIDADNYGIKVRKSPNGEEETLIFYNQSKELIGVDRSKTTLSAKEICNGVQSGKLALDDQNLCLHIYLDKSMIESYVNKKKMITTRAYPKREDSMGLEVWADGEVIIDSLEIWEMGSAYTKD